MTCRAVPSMRCPAVHEVSNPIHNYPPPQRVVRAGPVKGAWRRDPDPLGPELCRILHTDFREFLILGTRVNRGEDGR